MIGMWWADFKQKVKAIRQEKFIGYRYHLELCEREGDGFLCRGWLAGYEEAIESLEVVYTSGQECQRRKLSWIQRPDVEQAMNTPNALWSGFSLNDRVISRETVRVELAFRLKGKERTLFLAEICSVRTKDGAETLCVLPRQENGLNLKAAIEKSLDCSSRDQSGSFEEMIDIIVPVYNGMEYLPVLFRSIEKTNRNYRLLIIDDCSPDPEVQAYLEELARRKPSIVLKRNSENLGFVRSVNQALLLAEHPVALVNTDVELPEGWLERLMAPVLEDNRIASATPFTTCGTICSFPKVNEDNEIFERLSLEEVDSVFREFHPAYTEIPTGVGFCMGMSVKAIREIGIFDEKAFGKGYGEENDWCLRAEKAGYKNVLVENLFVYHKHGGSFLPEDKKRYQEKNLRVLQERYPDYGRKLAWYLEWDPAKRYRDLGIWRLCENYCQKRTRLYLDHAIGGGAGHYLEARIQKELAGGEAGWILRYSAEKGYLLHYCCRDWSVNFTMDRLEELEVLFQYGRIQEMVVNELVTYPELEDLLESLLQKKEHYGVKLTMLLHDYYAICPTINLLNENFVYCGLKDEHHCDECLEKNETNPSACRNIREWRQMWGRFLEQCDRIVVFSESSAELLGRAYPFLKMETPEADLPMNTNHAGGKCPGKEKIVVIPHQVDYLSKLKERAKTTSTFNIGVLGLINRHKGLDIIRDVAREWMKQEKNYRIIILGTLTEEIVSENVIVAGPYKKEELGEWIGKYDIDLIWIPSIWPETFSYTTEEAIRMGLPVAVFEMGAQAERVKKYEKGMVIPEVSVRAVMRTLKEYGDRNRILQI